MASFFQLHDLVTLGTFHIRRPQYINDRPSFSVIKIKINTLHYVHYIQLSQPHHITHIII